MANKTDFPYNFKDITEKIEGFKAKEKPNATQDARAGARNNICARNSSSKIEVKLGVKCVF